MPKLVSMGYTNKNNLYAVCSIRKEDVSPTAPQTVFGVWGKHLAG